LQEEDQPAEEDLLGRQRSDRLDLGRRDDLPLYQRRLERDAGVRPGHFGQELRQSHHVAPVVGDGRGALEVGSQRLEVRVLRGAQREGVLDHYVAAVDLTDLAAQLGGVDDLEALVVQEKGARDRSELVAELLDRLLLFRSVHCPSRSRTAAVRPRAAPRKLRRSRSPDSWWRRARCSGRISPSSWEAWPGSPPRSESWRSRRAASPRTGSCRRERERSRSCPRGTPPCRP